MLSSVDYFDSYTLVENHSIIFMGSVLRLCPSNCQMYGGWELILSHQFMFLTLDCHLRKLIFHIGNQLVVR